MDKKNRSLKMAAGSLAAFMGGCGLACQASMNAALAKPLSSAFAATCFSFYMGMLCLALAFPFKLGLKRNPPSGKPIKWWFYVAPGCVGSFFVSMGTFIGPRIGFSLYFVCIIFGQLLMGLYIDHVGMLDIPKAGLTRMKIFAFFIVLGGSLLAVLDFERISVKASTGMVVLYMILSVIAGACVSSQVPITSSFTRRKGTLPHRTALMAFSMGGLIVSIVWGIAAAVNPDIRTLHFDQTEWWMFFGGALGAFYVFLSVMLGHVLGVALFFISVVAGQLSMSLVIDSVGLFNSAEIEITAKRLIGVIFVFLGAVMFRASILVQRTKSSAQANPITSSSSFERGVNEVDGDIKVESGQLTSSANEDSNIPEQHPRLNEKISFQISDPVGTMNRV